MFGHTIMLWYSRWRELRNYSALLQMKTKLVTQIFSSTIRIVETLFSCYDDFLLHSEILWTFQMFQTCVSLSRYTHICSNHLWRSENNDTRHEPQHSSNHIHQYALFPISQLLTPLFRSLSHVAHEAWFASIKWFIIKWFQKSISMEFLHALHQYDLNGSATYKFHYHY